MNCIHGFEKDVEPPVKGMHRCSCCGLNGSNIYIEAGAKWPRTDPMCQDCRDAEDKLKAKDGWTRCEDGSLMKHQKLRQGWGKERNMPISLFTWLNHRWLLSAFVVLIAPLVAVFYFSGVVFMTFTLAGVVVGITFALLVRKWRELN